MGQSFFSLLCSEHALTPLKVASFVLCICSCLATKYGAGHHILDIPASYTIPSMQLGFVSLILYQLSLALSKISICIFYGRVFTDKTSRWLINSTIAVICLYTIPTVLFSIFQCKPISGAWDTTEGAVCQNTTSAFYASGICNIVIDTWLIAMIAPRIWGLQMAHRAKIALLGIVTLGWLVIVAAVVRMIKLGAIFKAPRGQLDVPCRCFDSLQDAA